MIARDRKKSGWPIALVVVLALLACGLLISLAMRKNAEVDNIERKFSPNGVVVKPTPKFAPLEPQADP